MISKWLQRLRGDSGSDSSSTSKPAEPATMPEPSSTPSEPPADAGIYGEGMSESSGDQSA